MAGNQSDKSKKKAVAGEGGKSTLGSTLTDEPDVTIATISRMGPHPIKAGFGYKEGRVKLPRPMSDRMKEERLRAAEERARAAEERARAAEERERAAEERERAAEERARAAVERERAAVERERKEIAWTKKIEAEAKASTSERG